MIARPSGLTATTRRELSISAIFSEDPQWPFIWLDHRFSGLRARRARSCGARRIETRGPRGFRAIEPSGRIRSADRYRVRSRLGRSARARPCPRLLLRPHVAGSASRWRGAYLIDQEAPRSRRPSVTGPASRKTRLKFAPRQSTSTRRGATSAAAMNRRRAPSLSPAAHLSSAVTPHRKVRPLEVLTSMRLAATSVYWMTCSSVRLSPSRVIFR